MSTIVIKDLPESVALDRQAMLAIAGGSRSPTRGRLAGSALLQNTGLLVRPSVSGILSAARSAGAGTADKTRK